MAPDEPTDVMRLAETLERLAELHGRVVWVRGVLHLEFEGRELTDGRSRIWVDLNLPKDFKTPLASLDGRQVIVRGAVDREDTGHMGLWPAALLVDRIVKP